MDSREKFEQIYGPMGFDLTRMYCAAPEPWSEYHNEKTGYAWAGWQAGRESMRDEAVKTCENEHLEDPQTGEDGVYDMAVHHCVAALQEIKP